MIENKKIGCFKNKIKLDAKIRKWQKPLAMIALIHHIGALKYPYYSWYNNPVSSDATPDNNLNAILRHFTAHRMGKTIDPESGLPHIFHAVCRAGMLITNLYREENDCKDRISRTESTKDLWDIGSQLTAEEILVISKDDRCKFFTNLADAPTYINKLLGDLLLTNSSDFFDTSDIFTCVTPFDELVLNIWHYADILASEHRFSYGDKLSEKTIDFVDEYIDSSCKILTGRFPSTSK